MQTRQFPKILAVLIIVIAIISGFAEEYSWYWKVRWLDMPMHFAGGVWVAGVAIWWVYFRNYKKCTFISPLITAILSAIAIGILWELFEAVTSFTVAREFNEILDTLSDMFFDTLGGIFTAVLVWFYKDNKLV